MVENVWFDKLEMMLIILYYIIYVGVGIIGKFLSI